MKYEDFEKKFETLGDKAQADGDVYFVCFFSREQNGYNAFWQEKMDFGDALLIIDGLINSFNLSRPTIARIIADNESRKEKDDE